MGGGGVNEKCMGTFLVNIMLEQVLIQSGLLIQAVSYLNSTAHHVYILVV